MDLTETEEETGQPAAPATGTETEKPDHTTRAPVVSTDAPMCSDCGSLMTRNGSCYKCHNCGGTSGCS